MVPENFSTIRHDLIFNASDFHHIKVVIAGAGSVGSRIAEELAALGVPNFEVYDPDVVEAVNTGSQAYNPDHVGLSKVDAIKQICRAKSGCILDAHQEEFHGSDSTANVYFLCVNGLPMRRLIVENIVKNNPHAEVIIEVRMGVIHGEVFFFNPQLKWQVDEWLKRTTGDETEVGTTACGTKLSVGFVSKALAQIAVGNFVHWCAKHAPAYTGELTRDNDQVIRTLHDAPINNRVLFSAIPTYALTDVWEAPRINPLLVDNEDLWSN